LKLFWSNKRKAQEFHELGQIQSDEGDESAAIASYLKAIELDPKKSESYYNLGLIYKYQGEWDKSLEFNAEAYRLDPDDEAARWNLAIAATALRNWPIARRAWADNGIKLDGDSGPINMDFGIAPVRLNPDGNGEVVWTTRIDPVRARIDNIPYRESGFKHGDIVLHDGAPVGSRKIGEKEYSVFNVLELFEESNYTTIELLVSIECDADLEILENLFSSTPHYFEDWTSNVRILCKQCSEGKPHDHHDIELKDEWNPKRTLGVAVLKNESVSEIFDVWQKECKGRLLEIIT
jgi:hypothetical protein